MTSVLFNFYSLICGQHPGHLWSPGGQLLPCCQRCVGLYTGTFFAVALHLLFRPKLDGWLRWLHVGFLLVMIPCALYWVPQNGVLRTVSGFLFGAGVIAFLWILPTAKIQQAKRGEVKYALGLILAVAATLVLACFGGIFGAYVLTAIILLGSVLLVVLAFWNVVLIFKGSADRKEEVFRVKEENWKALI